MQKCVISEPEKSRKIEKPNWFWLRFENDLNSILNFSGTVLKLKPLNSRAKVQTSMHSLQNVKANENKNLKSQV